MWNRLYGLIIILKTNSINFQTAKVGLSFQSDIIVGEFVERDRTSFIQEYDNRMKNVLGDAFVPYEGTR